MRTSILSILIVVFIAAGCSPSNGRERKGTETPPATLQSVEVQFYKEDPRKAQPELILQWSDENDLNAVQDWMGNRRGNTSIAPELVDQLYLLQLDYGTKERVTGSKYVLYAITSEDQYYRKEIKLDDLPDVQLDTFNKTMMRSIIQKMGSEGWEETALLHGLSGSSISRVAASADLLAKAKMTTL